ncbi:Potassium/sodium hyperpolarization-activated cyclic nucleotide-gated channel 4, partial [Stegodyphus mimosarum]
MYFIQEGIVDIVMSNGEVATSLSDGSYFGEICLLTNAKRVASVRAETYCNLFSLSVEHFNAVLNMYPLMRRTMESIAAERLNKIGKNPSLVSNREDLQHDLKAVNAILLSTHEHDTACDSSDDSDDLPPAFRNKKLKKHSIAMAVSKTLRNALPRPKSESCFNNMEQGGRPETSFLQRSETFYQSTSLAPPPPESSNQLRP